MDATTSSASTPTWKDERHEATGVMEGGEVKILRESHGFWVFIGPWAGRLDWGPGWFGWRDTDNRVIRFIRRWWSGWHRWEDEL